MKKESESEVRYPANRELGKRLKRGEREIIANLTGLKVSYVRNIFTGQRNNDLAVALATEIIKRRTEQIHNHVFNLIDNIKKK